MSIPHPLPLRPSSLPAFRWVVFQKGNWEPTIHHYPLGGILVHYRFRKFKVALNPSLLCKKMYLNMLITQQN